MLMRIMRRYTRMVAVAPAIVTAIACSDAVAPRGEAEVQIAAARLTFGTDKPTNLANGGNVKVTFGPLTTHVLVTVRWLDASGHILPDAAAAHLELRITGAAFTRRGGSSGWISELAPGSTVLQVVAWHTEKARAEFEGGLQFVIPSPPDALGPPDADECDNAVDPWCY